MKSEEGKNRRRNGRSNEENVTPVAVTILKTMVLLDRAYGPGYILRVVRGDEQFQHWKSPDPRNFETFGELSERYWDYLVQVFHHLVNEGFIEPRVPAYNVLEITDKGLAFLENPHELPVKRWQLRFTRYEKYLRRMLSQWRKNRAEADSTESYKLFPEFTLDRLVIEKPKTLSELSEVPGMSAFKAETYGSGILSVILEAGPDFEVTEKARIQELVQDHMYQYVKTCLERGCTIGKICSEVGCLEKDVLYMVEGLAIAGEVDLAPWIEKLVDGSTLYRGSEYFLNTHQPTIGEAFRTLGIDYETVKLCRLYAKYVATEPKMAASA